MPGEDQEVFLEHPVADVLAALPPTGTLEVFRTRFWENLDVDDLDDLKEMLSLPALRGLRTLYLTDTALLGYGLDDVDEEGEFEEWCKERGIEVFVSEVTEVRILGFARRSPLTSPAGDSLEVRWRFWRGWLFRVRVALIDWNLEPLVSCEGWENMRDGDQRKRGCERVRKCKGKAQGLDQRECGSFTR